MPILKDQMYDCFKHWEDNGVVWIISDTHFGEPLEECGFEWKPSDDDFVNSINSCVHKNDTLIILGDIGDIEPVKKIKGYKVLITGNHDKGVSNYKRKEEYIEVPLSMTIEEIKKKYPDFKSFFKLSDSEKIIYTDNKLFDEVYSGPLFISDRLLLSHEPIIDSDSCFYNIHGHVHGDKIIRTPYSFNVCADAIHFTPMRIDSLLKGGILKEIKNIHRFTTDNAIKRKSLDK